MHDGKHMPSQSISSELVPEKAGNVAKLVCFVTVDSFVVCTERVLEQLGPESVQLGKPFANKTKEFAIGPFLGTAFHDHGAKLMLKTGR
jgi:hypothetical protein